MLFKNFKYQLTKREELNKPIIEFAPNLLGFFLYSLNVHKCLLITILERILIVFNNKRFLKILFEEKNFIIGRLEISQVQVLS